MVLKEPFQGLLTGGLVMFLPDIVYRWILNRREHIKGWLIWPSTGGQLFFAPVWIIGLGSLLVGGTVELVKMTGIFQPTPPPEAKIYPQIERGALQFSLKFDKVGDRFLITNRHDRAFVESDLRIVHFQADSKSIVNELKGPMDWKVGETKEFGPIVDWNRTGIEGYITDAQGKKFRVFTGWGSQSMLGEMIPSKENPPIQLLVDSTPPKLRFFIKNQTKQYFENVQLRIGMHGKDFVLKEQEPRFNQAEISFLHEGEGLIRTAIFSADVSEGGKKRIIRAEWKLKGI
jgi:hypothetical protein